MTVPLIRPILIGASLTLLMAGCRSLDMDAHVRARLDRAAFDEAVERAIAEHGDGMESSVWIAGAEGEPWYARAEHAWRPGASSVKTAYLIELFAENAGRLDEPLAGTEEILEDPTHPAIVHFDEETQAEIRRDIEGATVRRVGEMMIRGTGVSNAVYNAAANVTTAALGGPEELTGRILARAPSFEGMAIRRYMLAARNVTGDNEVTSATLGAVLQRAAQRRIPGLDAAATEAVREILHLETVPDYGDHLYKSGSLSTDPLVQIRSGVWEKNGHAIVYAVIATQPDPAGRERPEAYQRLTDTNLRLTEQLLDMTWDAMTGTR